VKKNLASGSINDHNELLPLVHTALDQYAIIPPNPPFGLEGRLIISPYVLEYSD
jgi:hypothetical protein